MKSPLSRKSSKSYPRFSYPDFDLVSTGCEVSRNPFHADRFQTRKSSTLQQSLYLSFTGEILYILN